MGHALVVFESIFGNTRAVAAAVAEGLGAALPTVVREVREAPPTLAPDVELLVVGAPTHAFGLPRSSTRADAAKHGQGPGVGAETGMREWLAALSAPSGLAAAAFCTAATEPRWIHTVGTACKGLGANLKQHGLEVVSPPERFYVNGMTGPLADGELERARAWGAQLARLLDDRTAVPGGGRAQRRAPVLPG